VTRCRSSVLRGQGSGIEDQGSGVRGQGSGWKGGISATAVAAVGFLPALLSCGVKAPPQPREVMVPAPVEEMSVRDLPEGVRITFTLPSKSLDGTPLKGIGGYRIVREGPDGKDVREDIRFSVSEMRQMIGKSASFLDEAPGRDGTYRYCVVPLDMYGSHPGWRRVQAFCWEGSLAGRGTGRTEPGREQTP